MASEPQLEITITLHPEGAFPSDPEKAVHARLFMSPDELGAFVGASNLDHCNAVGELANVIQLWVMDFVLDRRAASQADLEGIEGV